MYLLDLKLKFIRIVMSSLDFSLYQQVVVGDEEIAQGHVILVKEKECKGVTVVLQREATERLAVLCDSAACFCHDAGHAHLPAGELVQVLQVGQAGIAEGVNLKTVVIKRM